MIKPLLISSIIVLNVFSSTIHFEEEKYIEVLGNSIIKKGTLTFKDNTIKFKYINSNESLIYKNNNLTIKNGEEIKEIDINKQFTLKLVFLLIEAINNNDLISLNEYFIVNKETNVYILKPKEELKNYLKKILFKKDQKLDFLTIHMTNGNTTTIRELND